MSLSLAELRAVVTSLRPRLVGGQIQRVRQPDDEHVVLTVRGRDAAPGPDGAEAPAEGGGATWDVLVCVRPRLSRVHLTWRTFAVPPAPLAFTQRLRSTVLNGRVRDVALPWPDRVLAIDIFHAGEDFRLLVEMTGHHANAFLLGGDGTILTSLRPTASRRRDLRPGRPYAPPLRPDAIGGVGEGDAPGARDEALHRTLDAAYAARDTHDVVNARLAALRRRLKGALARAERRAARVQADLARAAEAGDLRHRGELLSANLHTVRKGMTAIEVVDWTRPDDGPVRIPLDPSLSPQENLETLFGSYRKKKRAGPITERRHDAAEEEAASLRLLLGRLDGVVVPDAESSGDLDERAAAANEALGALERAADALGVAPGPRHAPHGGKQTPPRRLPYRRYAARDGTPILVGRGGADNHELTFKVASEADPWLHVRDGAGAHVVVRRDKRRPVSRETLLDAALLAAHFSKRREDSTFEVHVTPRRLVRPLKGAPPGTVRVERSDTLVLGRDPEQLARLLATRQDGSDGPE